MIELNKNSDQKTPRMPKNQSLTKEKYYEEAKKKLPVVLWNIVVEYQTPKWIKYIRTKLVNGIIERPLTTEKELWDRLWKHISCANLDYNDEYCRLASWMCPPTFIEQLGTFKEASKKQF
jgi:hypothetical protein